MNKEITYTADNNIFADRFCRRIQYVKMIYRSLKPTGLFGIACFRPDLGDQGAPVREMSDWDVYEEGTMNGGLAFSAGVPFLWTSLWRKKN